MASTNRKHGRNKKSGWQKTYTAAMQWLTNKLKKLAKHLKLHPNDKQSKERKKPDYTPRTKRQK